MTKNSPQEKPSEKVVGKVLETAETLAEELRKIWEMTVEEKTVCIWGDDDFLICDDFDVRGFDPEADYVATTGRGTDICSYIRSTAKRGYKMLIFDLENKRVTTIYNWETKDKK
jgi:hypothetical protein